MTKSRLYLPLTLLGSTLLVMLLAQCGAPGAQPPVDVITAPLLEEGETPDYATHVEPILRRHCLPCHQGAFAQGGYSVADYTNVMESGNNAPNVVGGNLESNLIRMINRETIAAGGPMPPATSLSVEEIAVITRWVEAGALPPSDTVDTP